MDVNEIWRELFEKGQRDMAAVDKDRPLARTGHLAQNDELVLLLDLLLREQCAQLHVTCFE